MHIVIQKSKIFLQQFNILYTPHYITLQKSIEKALKYVVNFMRDKNYVQIHMAIWQFFFLWCCLTMLLYAINIMPPSPQFFVCSYVYDLLHILFFFQSWFGQQTAKEALHSELKSEKNNNFKFFPFQKHFNIFGPNKTISIKFN